MTSSSATAANEPSTGNANRFTPFRSAWNVADDAAFVPTSQFIWVNACATAMADGELEIIGAQRDNEFVAVAPFVSRNSGFWRYWTFLGEALYEPADVISRDADALDRLALAMVRHRESLHFDRLLADSPTIPALRRRARGRAIITSRPVAGCPFVSLDQCRSDPEALLNTGRRSDLRRSQKRASQIGPVTSEILTPSLAELDQLLAIALDVEARNWKGEENTAVLQDNYRRPFYLCYARAACQAGLLRLSFLRIGGQPVATQIAIQSANSLWLLKIGYDDAYARCSPGSLLIRDTIRYAAAAGLRTYEFLGRTEPWTQVWTKDEHACVALDLYPYRLRGMTVYARSRASAVKQKWRGKRL